MKYTPEEKERLFKKVIRGLESGKSLRETLKQDGMPGRGTLYVWVDASKDFQDRLARARDLGNEVLLDKALEDARNVLAEIIDEDGDTPKGRITKRTIRDNVARSRLIVQTTLDVLAIRNPVKYGKKLDVTTDGEKINIPPITGMVIKNEIAEELPNDDDLL